MGVQHIKFILFYHSEKLHNYNVFNDHLATLREGTMEDCKIIFVFENNLCTILLCQKILFEF